MLQMLQHRHDRGLYSIACDEEASAHYGIKHQGVSRWAWPMRCYLKGLFEPLRRSSKA